MNRRRKLARLIVAAAGLVATGVTINQVLNNNNLNWTWLYVSLSVAVIATVYGEVLAAPSTGSNLPRGDSLARGGIRRIYLRQLRASVRDMETIGIATQGEFVLRMKQVYVDVSLTSQPSQNTEHAEYIGRSSFPVGERRTLPSFFNREQRIFAVIGGPGSGKTTLIRRTALDLCKGTGRFWRRRPLPVLLYLRDHASALQGERHPPLAKVAASTGWLVGKIPSKWIDRQLDKGGCVVLLDGLDEVADEMERKRIVTWIKRQIERYPANNYIVTSRPHGYLSNPLSGAEVLQVRRFTGDQISKFLHNWYYAIEARATGSDGRDVRNAASAKADDLLSRLRSRLALYDLAANPLLLTMIANVHRYRGQLPNGRTALYAEMCDVLVHRRQEAKGLIESTGLNGEQKEYVIRVLALALMERRIRDISASDAAAIIEVTLRQVSRSAHPAIFLEEIRKSGLLIEREHGMYSFAHLTLQEYLSAAQIRELQRQNILAAAVNDPWWRETTLLWASRANATDIIDACLDSGTVQALSLAFDCAEEARQVAPDVRNRLDNILVPQGVGGVRDQERKRLITAVLAARTLRDIMWLDKGDAISVRPVPEFLYFLFAQHEIECGLHTPKGRFNRVADDAPPALGMWADDASRFVLWLNRHFDDGSAYRFPSRDELNDPAMSLINDFNRRSVWFEAGSHLALHHPDGVVSPEELQPEVVRDYVQLDRLATTYYLGLMLKGANIQDFTRTLSYALIIEQAFQAGVPAHGHSPWGLVRELIIARSTNYAMMRTEGLLREDAHLVSALNHSLSRLSEHAQEIGISLTQDSFSELAKDLDESLIRIMDELRQEAERIPSLDVNPFSSDELARDLENGYNLAVAQIVAGGLESYLEWELTRLGERARVLNRALDHNLNLSNDLYEARTRARTTSSGITVELGRENTSLSQLRSLCLVQALDLNDNLGLDFDVDLSIMRGQFHDQIFVAALDLDRAVDYDRDVRIDMAVDIALASLNRGAQVAVNAYSVLLESWTSSLRRGARIGEAVTSFDKHLTGLIENITASTNNAAADPLFSMVHAIDLIDEAQSGANNANREVKEFVVEACELVRPILSRQQPFDPHTLSCARMGLLASLCLLRDSHDRPEVRFLVEAFNGLISLQERVDGRIAANEILLLVRV